jgi:hypothetical protein
MRNLRVKTTRKLTDNITKQLLHLLSGQFTDFSVVLFRPNFMLASEGCPMKVHKNQRLLTLPSPLNLPCGATNQGTYHGVWWTDAFAVT